MSAVDRRGDEIRIPATPPAQHAGGTPLAKRQRRQLLLITGGAIAIFLGLRWLPTGTNLSHMDFRVDPKATNAIEFCDPLNPQFIPVVAARSPVTMSLVTAEPAAVGREVRAVVTLKTGSGKPVAPEDLLVTHTRRLHLLVIDPTLEDYQHAHPEPGERPGEWAFRFTPRRAGPYRVFADFTPAATARGLYSSVDLDVAGSASDLKQDPAVRTETPPIPAGADSSRQGRINSSAAGAAAHGRAQAGERTSPTTVERDGVVFTLTAAPQPARAGQPIDLRFTMAKRDGGDVPLEPVMGAFAHVVAFDAARSGFAHLHPTEPDPLKRPDARHPVLNFKLTIPRAGQYVIWAQVNLGGVETFVPFDFEVK